MKNFDADIKKYYGRLKRLKDVPSYAKGFKHVIKQIEYCNDVVSGKIERCRLIIASCESFLEELLYRQYDEDFKYRFDPIKAERTAFFIETLSHVKGRWGSCNAKIVLEPWQCDIICGIFGWVYKDTGYRRYNEAYLEIPRKNGKSVIGAGTGLYMFMADNESGSEVYCGAKNRKQALEVFKPARLMLMRNQGLIKKYRPDIKIESISLEDGSIFEPIVGVPIDGGSPHCSILDEIHQHLDGGLYESQQTGLGARDQPLILMITTAGYDLFSFCKQKHDENVANILGTVHDDILFSRIYTIDEEDRENIYNPNDYQDAEKQMVINENLRIIKKANPNFGVSVKETYLLSQCEKSFKSNEARVKFLTKHLDCWVNASMNYFDMQAVTKCANSELSINDFIGCDCVISVDLSSKLDLGCICVAFCRNENGDNHYYVFPEFFLPEATMLDNENLNHIYYERFAQTNSKNTQCGKILNVSDGFEVNYLDMTEIIAERAGIFHPKEVIFDSYNALQMEQECEKNYGLNVIEFSKTTAFFSPAMKEMNSAITSGRFHYDGNECLAWNIANVESKTDNNGNDFPKKANLRAENKIDGCICAIMAIGRMMIWCDEDSDGHYREIYADY
jgi:phage terminase large subunit-like protein